VTVIGRARAAGERRRHDDAALARLARTDLLGLEEIGRRIEARNQPIRATWPRPPTNQPAADQALTTGEGAGGGADGAAPAAPDEGPGV
jgi:hypothetical protein